MPMSVWFGVKFTPGGHSTFFGLLNAFVHIVMYTYYMFSAMGPQFQKYLWWKKYLTTFQMVSLNRILFRNMIYLGYGILFVTGSIHFDYDPCLPIVVHRLQLS